MEGHSGTARNSPHIDNDASMTSGGSTEHDPLLHPAPEDKWKAPRGFIWIEIGEGLDYHSLPD